MDSKKMLKALEELKKAQADIERLQNERDKAMKLVEQAKTEAKPKGGASKETPSYHSQKYWDQRYEKEEKDSSYEWYVQFPKIKPLVSRDIEDATRIFIPGCGNSVLGEDMAMCWKYLKIVSVDYSDTVVKTMQKRATEKKLKQLKYKTGNLFNLSQETDASYDVILDKGTLDAIASNNTNTNNNAKKELDDVGKYITEMWRILQPHGKFIIISTMTIEIFESFVLPYLQTWSIEQKKMYSVCNWEANNPRNLRYQFPLTTDAGGTVYYYLVEKLVEIKQEKQVIMESISSLLETAQIAAREAMLADEEVATASVPTQPQDATPAAAATYCEQIHSLPPNYNSSKVELKIDYQRSVLQPNGYLIVQYVLLEGQFDENDMIRLVCCGSDLGSNENDWYQDNEPGCECFEYISLLPPPPALVSDSSRRVLCGETKLQLPCYGGDYYLLYVRDMSHPSSPLPLPSSSTTTNLNTNNTTSQQQQLVHHYVKLGQSDLLSIRFPCAPYHPDLPRRKQSTTIINSQPIQRRRKVGPIQPSAHFDVMIEDLQAMQRLSITISLKKKQKKQEEYHDVMICRVMGWCFPSSHIITSTDSSSSSSSSGSSNGDAESIYVLVEVDLIQIQRNGMDNDDNKRIITTENIPIYLSADRAIAWSHIKIAQCYGELIPSLDSSSFASSPMILLRLPYHNPSSSALLPYTSIWNTLLPWDTFRARLPQSQSQSQSQSQLPLQQQVESSKELEQLQICCRNCDQILVNNIKEDQIKRISRIHPLPTGIFDENMHEFICCENIGNCGMNLTTDQMIIPDNALYYGPLYTILSGSHLITPKVCSFGCKANMTVCDILTTMGAAVAVSALPNYSSSSQSTTITERLHGLITAFVHPILGIDTCIVQCTRCQAYLGDALLKPSDVLPGGAAMNEDAASAIADGVEEDELSFRQEEIATIKLCWDKVSFQSSSTSTSIEDWQSIYASISFEQVLTRLMVHIYEKFNIPVICFYNSELLPSVYGSTSSVSKKALSEKMKTFSVVMVKIMNKNYRMASSSSSSTSVIQSTIIQNQSYQLFTLRGNVKVSIQTGNAIDLVKGKEARVPLLHEDFVQLHRLLKEKKQTLDGFISLTL